MLRVSDLDRAARFYETEMGMRRAWTDIEREQIGFVFPESESEIVIHRDPSIPSPDLSFLVDDVVAFCDEQRWRGHVVRREPLDVRCGKLAVLEDPDGNLVQIIDLSSFSGAARYDDGRVSGEPTTPLRETFDHAAELYDRIRPGYPDALLDDLALLAGLGPRSRLLELGVGTGQATEALAERGYRIVGVELGERLARLARQRLARFGARVEIIVDSFDTWQLPWEPFDAVVAATSFHWLDAATRVGRAAAALRPGGHLATIATHHIASGDQALFEQIHECYLRWDPSETTRFRLPAASEIASEEGEIVESGQFDAPVFRRYEWERRYRTADYLDLLRTYSGHLALPADRLAHLLDCIAAILDREGGGHVTKRYLNELRVARRR